MSVNIIKNSSNVNPDLIAKATQQLIHLGFAITTLDTSGDIQRVYVKGDIEGSQNGWYRAELVHLSSGVAVDGAYGSWKVWDTNGDMIKHKITQQPAKITSEDADKLKKAQAESKKKQDEFVALKHAEAAKEALKRWDSTSKGGESDYLTGKQVNAYGLRFYNGQIIVPVRNIEGELVGLQYIKPDGTKRFLPGTQKKGSFHLIGEPTGLIAIAEGYATAATIHQATGWSVAVAFDAGNLIHVSKALRKKYPDSQIVICGDSDKAGQAGAKKVAHAVNASIVTPTIPDGKGTDWNDLAALEGLDTVKTQLLDAAGTGTDDSTEAKLSELAELKQSNLIAYGQARKGVAKELGISVAILDQEVDRRIAAAIPPEEDTALAVVEDLEPWEETVIGSYLLNEIREMLRKHLVLPEQADTALAAWTLGTYCMDAWKIFPKILLNSPTMQCGKTTCMEVLQSLARRQYLASNITAPGLFRVIDMYGPTLFLDEADTFLKDNRELNGIINSGHTKSGASVTRLVGDDHTPKAFSTWCPQVIAGIGFQKGTLHDRSIHILLHKKKASDDIQKVPFDIQEQNIDIRRKCLRWAQDNHQKLVTLSKEVTPPPCGNDRTQDNWIPLFTIAQAVQSFWIQDVLDSYNHHAKHVHTGPDYGVMLLEDMRQLFNIKSAWWSKDIVTKLKEMEDRPWNDWGEGGLTQSSLSAMIKNFGIGPERIWLEGKGGKKKRQRGYNVAWFKDVFERYLPASGTP